MNSLTLPSSLSLITLLLTTGVTTAQSNEDKRPAVTMSKALKLGIEKLTQFTDESEAGMDHAAVLYATAKRIETEHGLAQRDLDLVLALDEWRTALTQCRQASLGLASIVNGGGTMYAHGAARDAAEVEDFLASFAQRLPLAEGKGNASATKLLDDAIAFITKLKPADQGDAAANKTAKADLAKEVKRVTEFWQSLKVMVGDITPDAATKVAEFAVDSLGWLKE